MIAVNVSEMNVVSTLPANNAVINKKGFPRTGYNSVDLKPDCLKIGKRGKGINFKCMMSLKVFVH